MTKITSFENLIAWQKSQDLAVSIYMLTKSFPNEEQFALTNQMRRAGSSISANIAEGFGRKSKKEKIQFYRIAYGSLLEVKNFIYLSSRLNYVDENKTQEIIAQITDCQKLINAIIKSVDKYE